jgi:3' exoribonuclease family, domain 1
LNIQQRKILSLSSSIFGSDTTPYKKSKENKNSLSIIPPRGSEKRKMPLDTSTTYPLTKLRLDGRRWNELRLLQAQISTNPASSGSSYLSMGNTSIMVTVHGPHETTGGGGGGGAGSEAAVDVDVNIAGFAGIDRKRRAGGSDR